MVIPDSIRQELHGIKGTSLSPYDKVLSICTHDQGVGAIFTSKVNASYLVSAWPPNIKDRLTNNPGVQAFVGTAAVLNALKTSSNFQNFMLKIGTKKLFNFSPQFYHFEILSIIKTNYLIILENLRTEFRY